MVRRSLLILAACPAILLAQRSQGSERVTIDVRVADSASAPVAAADVMVLRGVTDAVAHGMTDASGRVRLEVARSSDELQLSVRHIGFQAAYRFFQLAAPDTMRLDVRLARTTVTLGPVTVSAAQDLKRKSYHLTAEDIEHSARPIIDGADIFKLRPDMMNSRGGPKACEVPQTPRTGWIESVWVNGVRVTLGQVDSVYVASRKSALGIPPAVAPRPNLSLLPASQRAPLPPPPAFTVFSHIDTVLSILHDIRPEHIAEITYKDCFDASVGKNNSDLAMFIVLKPGIGYDQARGSYVMQERVASTDASSQPRPISGSLPRFRFRVLGVFDQQSGEALSGVDVAALTTGDHVTTTATGTVSLYFLPEGTGKLRLHRDGFRDTTLTVTISPADTVPMTIVMRRPR